MPIITGTWGTDTQVGPLVENLVLNGFSRARINAIYSAWIATNSRALRRIALQQIRELVTFRQFQTNLAADQVNWQASIALLYDGQRYLVQTGGSYETAETAIEAAKRVAVNHFVELNPAVYDTVFSGVLQQSQAALNQALVGIPTNISTFFLVPPVVESGEAECSLFASESNFIIQIIAEARGLLRAKSSNHHLKTKNYNSIGTCCSDSNNCPPLVSHCTEREKKQIWDFDNIDISYHLRAAEKPTNMDQGVYDEITAWIASLDFNSISSELNSYSNEAVAQEFQQQASAWIQSLNNEAAFSPLGSLCSMPIANMGENCNFGPYQMVSESTTTSNSDGNIKSAAKASLKFASVSKFTSISGSSQQSVLLTQSLGLVNKNSNILAKQTITCPNNEEFNGNLVNVCTYCIEDGKLYEGDSLFSGIRYGLTYVNGIAQIENISTSAGSDVPVSFGLNEQNQPFVELVFTSVTSDGETSIEQIVPGAPPAADQSTVMAYSINTTATFEGPINVDIVLPSNISQTAFNRVRGFHVKNDGTMEEMTIISSDFSTRKITVTISSFSSVVITQPCGCAAVQGAPSGATEWVTMGDGTNTGNAPCSDPDMVYDSQSPRMTTIGCDGNPVSCIRCVPIEWPDNSCGF